MYRVRKNVTAALVFISASVGLLATALPASAERHIRLAECHSRPSAVGNASLATKNGKQVISLTANFDGDAGFKVVPLGANFTADKLYEKPTSMVVDFNGNRLVSSFSLYVILDYIEKGVQRRATQIGFGGPGEFQLKKQTNGTYLATINKQALDARKIGPDDQIESFVVGVRNADNTDPNFTATLFISDVTFHGQVLPVNVSQKPLGCNTFD